jgi:hypothetical protein
MQIHEADSMYPLELAQLLFSYRTEYSRHSDSSYASMHSKKIREAEN